MRLARSVAFALFVPASALPQDTPAGMPPPVVLRVQVLGPAGWRARLGPTNLGTMLATEAAERIWRRYADAVDGAMRGAQGDAAAFARARHAAASAEGHGRVDASVLLGRHLPGMLGLLGTATSLRLPRPAAVAAEAEAWLPLLARHGMSVATRTCSATATSWSQRVLW
ncbi:MAG TPA: hypothetical protein VFD82_04395 [Planctomycetota bacterium]|nr:hypothetical protein [Planctomycetota bacterium]